MIKVFGIVSRNSKYTNMINSEELYLGGVYFMRIVVVKMPKFIGGILKRVFKIG